MNFSSHFIQLLVFTAFVLKYNIISARRGHGGHSRIGTGYRQSHHRLSSFSSGSHNSHSHRGNFASSRSGHGSRHNSAIHRVSGNSRSSPYNYNKHHFRNRQNSRHSLSSNLRHSSKSDHHVHHISNKQILDSSVHIHNRNRNKHISSKSLSISPTINSVSYNNPFIGVGGVGIPYSVNPIPAVAVGLSPTVVNIQPGFADTTPPFIDGPLPPIVNRPSPYPVGSPYLNTPPSQYRPRCYDEFRQITDDGQEIVILKFYALDELYLHDLNNYLGSSNKEFEGTYPCDYYEPNIR